MHSYKSLFVVIVMGGVLFMVAGILVTTDAAQRKKAQSNSNSAELPERARIGDREILLRGRGANASPAGTSFEHEIGEFREWLATPAARDAAAKVRTRGLVSMLCRNVQASDWPLLAAELERKDSPDEYRGNLLVIAGAARVDQALPYFEKYGASLPSKVAEAFRLDGRDQAFAVLTNLYRQSTQSGAKYLYLGAIRNFSSAVVRPFLRHQLTAENDLEALMQVVTLSRFFPDAELALALVDFARGASTDRQAAARRAMNSVAGMELGDAGRAVFEAW
ncbi:MAG: hypothetical protein KDB53_18000, partial [Planctomycetes bacterium]|nr:hypothetical protein [Planctomycetota bacterium]